MTTQQYIKKLDFEYLETYSLLRQHEAKDYVGNLQKEIMPTVNETDSKKLVELPAKGTKKQLLESANSL